MTRDGINPRIARRASDAIFTGDRSQPLRDNETKPQSLERRTTEELVSVDAGVSPPDIPPHDYLTHLMTSAAGPHDEVPSPRDSLINRTPLEVVDLSTDLVPPTPYRAGWTEAGTEERVEEKEEDPVLKNKRKKKKLFITIGLGLGALTCSVQWAFWVGFTRASRSK